jgi:GTP diphosphokinase / guanosine-3',5'-bis(diphosphate) 3'-diphosphatase
MEKIDKNCSNVNKDMVSKAYYFADKAHKKQKRESGDPYITHPVEVTCILADMGMILIL